NLQPAAVGICEISLPTVSPRIMAKLEEPIKLEEVEEAIWRLRWKRSPGPYGLTAEFYNAFAGGIAPILTSVFASLQNYELTYFNGGLVAMVPKHTDCIRHVQDIRPISLLGVD